MKTPYRFKDHASPRAQARADALRAATPAPRPANSPTRSGARLRAHSAPAPQPAAAGPGHEPPPTADESPYPPRGNRRQATELTVEQQIWRACDVVRESSRQEVKEYLATLPKEVLVEIQTLAWLGRAGGRASYRTHKKITARCPDPADVVASYLCGYPQLASWITKGVLMARKQGIYFNYQL